MNVVDITDKIELKQMIDKIKLVMEKAHGLPDGVEKQECLELHSRFMFGLELSMFIMEHGYQPKDFLRTDIFNKK